MFCKPKFIFIVLLSLFFLFACNKADEEDVNSQNNNNSSSANKKVQVWVSNNDGSIKLQKLQENLAFQFTPDFDLNIIVDESVEYQEMYGFGAALSGSSAYNIQAHLNTAQKSELLTSLFSQENGIGINLLRLTIGASDFSLSNYTYNDMPPNEVDPELQNFDLSVEDEYLIPLLQEILSINPNLKIIASPWSAPAWMKDNQSLNNGGHLKTEFLETYANYFVKYIQEMSDRNITIDAITVQNEPLHSAGYPTMEMTAQEQNIFIRDYLGPAFEANSIDSKIIIYDHNWDATYYPLTILNDETTKDYIDGVAFHCYAGEVEAMSDVKEIHNDVGIYFTECSGGNFAPDYGFNIAWNVDNLLCGAVRNWSKTILFWNLALDENSGPKNGGCQDCRGVVTINSNTKEVSFNEEYVILGHIAKFVKAGAKRIETIDTRQEGVSQIAFKNPDGTSVIICYNHNDVSQLVQFKINDNFFAYSIEAASLITFFIEN